MQKPCPPALASVHLSSAHYLPAAKKAKLDSLFGTKKMLQSLFQEQLKYVPQRHAAQENCYDYLLTEEQDKEFKISN